MKFENTKVFNFDGAFRGMRNPLNSWAKSDSEFNILCNYCINEKCDNCKIVDDELGLAIKIGKADMNLAKKLIQGGSEHRKFLRQIFVSVDITAPSYFMAELDTYKIGVTRNSTSFQHKGTSKLFTIKDFEIDNEELYEILLSNEVNISFMGDELYREYAWWKTILSALNRLRDEYLETKDYKYFRKIRQLLPQSYLYTSTFTMNYENLYSMVHQRKNHKLKEWSKDFISWVHTLPYADDLIFNDDKKED